MLKILSSKLKNPWKKLNNQFQEDLMNIFKAQGPSKYIF